MLDIVSYRILKEILNYKTNKQNTQLSNII